MFNLEEFIQKKNKIANFLELIKKEDENIKNYQMSLELHSNEEDLKILLGNKIAKSQLEKSNFTNEKNILNKYIEENRINVGKEIIEYLNLIKNESNDYLVGSDKNKNKLGKTISEIKICIEEIEKLYSILISLDNNLSSEIKNDPPITESSFILDPNKNEFSSYTLNNKTGYSLKSFFEQKKEEIKKVLEYFNEDYEKSIEYLQAKHGLCNGQKIETKTFEAQCSIHFGLKRINTLNVEINSIKIEGKNSGEVLINCFKEIGIEEIIKKCSNIFNKSLYISEYEIKQLPYGSVHSIVSKKNKLFYIFIHSSDIQKKKQLETIKNKLNINNLYIKE